jgi:hypothetical protein
MGRADKGFPVKLFVETVEQILNTPAPRARYALPGDVRLRLFLRRLMSDAWWDRQMRKTLKW